MTGTYPVTLGIATVGKALVEKQGLYYRFICNCNFSDKGIYTIYAHSGTHCESLGICIPDGKQYRLEKKVPMKHFPEKELRFSAVKKNTESGARFIPLENGGQFLYLTELMAARFQCLDGRCGVILRPESCCPATEDSAHP